jgi:hypothetical protein
MLIEKIIASYQRIEQDLMRWWVRFETFPFLMSLTGQVNPMSFEDSRYASCITVPVFNAQLGCSGPASVIAHTFKGRGEIFRRETRYRLTA